MMGSGQIYKVNMSIGIMSYHWHKILPPLLGVKLSTLILHDGTSGGGFTFNDQQLRECRKNYGTMNYGTRAQKEIWYNEEIQGEK